MRTEFRSSWLRGISSRFQSGHISECEYDVVLTASSWDCRCLCITNEKRISFEIALMIEFSTRDEQGLRDKHDKALLKHLRRTSNKLHVFKGSSSAVESLWTDIKKKLLEIANSLNRPISILLDISTIPRYLVGAALALGLKQGLASRITGFYAEGTYDNPTGDLQGVFTGERWRFVPIPGLEGLYNPVKKRFFLLSLGFEGSKTLRYLSTQEPDRVSVLFADPGFDQGYAERSRSNNAALLDYFHIPPQQIAAAHAGDAVAAWAELSARRLENFRLENVSYICCGTKPHSFALMLRALSVKTATVLYNVPDIHRVINTVPTGFVWTYDLNDVTRL